MSDNKVGTYKFVAEPFHCDFTGKLTMSVLGNHLLNCAGFHAADRGFGIATLNENHGYFPVWLLSWRRCLASMSLSVFRRGWRMFIAFLPTVTLPFLTTRGMQWAMPVRCGR